MGNSVLKTAILAADITKRSLEESGQIGGAKQVEEALVPKGEVYFTPMPFGDGSYRGQAMLQLEELVAIPDVLVVYFDGVRYQLISKTSTMDGQPIRYFGNLSVAVPGAENTGEPFIIADEMNGEITGGLFVITLEEYMWNGTDESKTMFGIYTQTETIHPIDPKYLPEGFGGGGLDTVRLTTTVPSEITDVVALSEEDCASLTTAAVKENPVILVFTDSDGLTIKAVAHYGFMVDGGATMYFFMVSVGVIHFQVLFDPGSNAWVISP